MNDESPVTADHGPRVDDHDATTPLRASDADLDIHTDTSSDSGQDARAGTDTGHESAHDAQREESFVVRLLVDGDGVRSTSVQHARENAPRRWPGWAPSEVIDFVEAHLGRLALTAPAGDPDGRAVAGGALAAGAAGGGGPAAGTGPNLNLFFGEPLPLQLSVGVEPGGPRAGEPFAVTLAVDFSQVRPPPAEPLEYRAVVGLSPGDTAPGPADDAADGTGQVATVLRAQGEISARSPSVQLTGAGLPAGRHRIDAAVSLRVRGVGRPVGLATATQVVLDIADR